MKSCQLVGVAADCGLESASQELGFRSRFEVGIGNF